MVITMRYDYVNRWLVFEDCYRSFHHCFPAMPFLGTGGGFRSSRSFYWCTNVLVGGCSESFQAPMSVVLSS